MMLMATDDMPLNFGFSGKGNTSDARCLEDVLRSGAAGFKLHEDWGTVCCSLGCICFHVSSCSDKTMMHLPKRHPLQSMLA
jgi:urease